MENVLKMGVTLMNYVRKYLAMLLFLGLFCHKKMQ